MAAAGTAEPVTARRRASLLVLPVAAAVALLVLIALLLPRLSDASAREQRRTEILAAARQHAVNFTTLDHRALDRDLGRVLAGATGKFRAQFKKGTADLSELVRTNKAVSEGEVLEAGIVTDDVDSARVLVVADSTVTNTADPDPQRRHYRLQLDLVHEDGRWLVSDLQFIG